VNSIPLQSDQSYNWSDQHAGQTHQLSPSKTTSAHPEPARFDCRPPGLPHRALQAVWKARVPVRTGPRTRPQVLPLRQQTGPEARDGLCSPRVSGKCERASGQFPQDQINPGGALRDQSRTPAAQGEALVRAPPCSLRGQHDSSVPSQCRRDCHSLCQYARRGAEKQSGPIGGQGGES
jgi:hypothetical protein